MSSKEKMRCRNVKKVIRYHTPNPAVDAEAYAHHLLMLFYPFRKESELCEIDGTYTSKLNLPEVLHIVNRNKEIFEPWGDQVELSLRQFTFRPRTDNFAEQENDDVEDEIMHNDDENELEDPVVDFEVEAQPNQRTQGIAPGIVIMSDDEINELIRSLNHKQREGILTNVILNLKLRSA